MHKISHHEWALRGLRSLDSFSVSLRIGTKLFPGKTGSETTSLFTFLNEFMFEPMRWAAACRGERALFCVPRCISHLRDDVLIECGRQAPSVRLHDHLDSPGLWIKAWHPLPPHTAPPAILRLIQSNRFHPLMKSYDKEMRIILFK